MENDPWVPPYSIKIMHDFLDNKYYNFLNDIIQNKDFYKARQGVGSNQIVDEKHIQASIKFRELVTTYNENRDLLMMGGYTQGQDQILDQAITLWPKITEFIKQKEDKIENFSASLSQLMQVFGN